jgi:hypothetical protein
LFDTSTFGVWKVLTAFVSPGGEMGAFLFPREVTDMMLGKAKWFTNQKGFGLTAGQEVSMPPSPNGVFLQGPNDRPARGSGERKSQGSSDRGASRPGQNLN